MERIKPAVKTKNTNLKKEDTPGITAEMQKEHVTKLPH